MLVDQVFHHREFAPGPLARLKRAVGLSVSVCIPARDEETTIGPIVRAVVEDLVQAVPLVDEVLVVDDGSTDATAGIAAAAGARVVAAASVLPELEPGGGKGDALWKSLFASSGDLVCWIDADIRDFGPRFVTGLLGPLLTRPTIGFVKGFYRRPLSDDDTGEGPTAGEVGGRVTELVARPLISKLFPHLVPVVQPLSGEYAGRRTVLEQVPFARGWGVDLALLIDIVERFGARAVAQVDLETRRHRNRPLEELGPQAMAILATALARAGLDDDAWGDDLVRCMPGPAGTLRARRVPIEVGERPPLVDVPAYRRLREQSA